MIDFLNIFDLFTQHNALLDGHFILSSGLHSDRYMQSALLLQSRDQLRTALQGLPGVTVFPSDANFLLFRCPKPVELHQHLLNAGLRARRFGAGPLDGCLRLSVGTPEQNTRIETALKGFR
jgi:histidinol-phosphate/aromatic aminotransferase/cobyric acid decarboxylase-like protein